MNYVNVSVLLTAIITNAIGASIALQGGNASQYALTNIFIGLTVLLLFVRGYFTTKVIPPVFALGIIIFTLIAIVLNAIAYSLLTSDKPTDDDMVLAKSALVASSIVNALAYVPYIILLLVHHKKASSSYRGDTPPMPNRPPPKRTGLDRPLPSPPQKRNPLDRTLPPTPIKK